MLIMKEVGKCFWPLISTGKVCKAIENQIKPDDPKVWEKYDVEILGKPYGEIS